MKKALFSFGVAGLLFSGYLSSVKLFTNTCALGESCPYFIGFPACYYGFAMHLALTVLATLLVFGKMNEKKALRSIQVVSFLGVLFAGYFTLGELPILFENGFSAYVFGLPTCALGLLFYLAIFFLSLFARRKA